MFSGINTSETINLHLTDTAFQNTISRLQEYGNTPNAEIEAALFDIIQTLTNIACGEAENKYYVSSIDPGLGKTTSIIQWLKVFVTLEEFKDTGALVCFDRLEQIESFLREAQFPHSVYSVCVSEDNDKKLNEKGTGDINKGQILITTKAQIILRSKRQLFREIEPFYFNNKPRTILIWDETLTAGNPVFLSKGNLGPLIEILSTKNKDLYSIVDKIFTDLKSYKNNDIYQMSGLDCSYYSFMGQFQNSPEDIKLKAEYLWSLAGNPVTVRSSSKGLALINFVEIMPPDFIPCLVTDASARIRTIYDLHQQNRCNLQYLKKAYKSYVNLTCHIWERSGGKTSLIDKDQITVVAQEIATVINNKPAEKFLVVHFKTSVRNSIVRAIKKNIETDSHRVYFLHYGTHTATNDYSDIPNIILAGILYYEEAEYEAIGRAACNRSTAEGSFTGEESDKVKTGELRHHILQAACRGAIRKCEGNNCPSTNLWMIGLPGKGINKESLQMIFPDCQVIPWKTTEVKLTEKQQLVLTAIQSRLNFGKAVIYVKDLYVINEIKIARDTANFKTNIIKESFIKIMDDLGLVLYGKGSKARFIKK